MTPQGHYHPLFMGWPGPTSPDGVIRVMPDHGHEGVLETIQGAFDSSEWPQSANGFQPKPVTVARGINKATGESIALVSAYDGQSLNVGRIVAHTTWHHFVNVNLHGFQVPEASETWAAISQFYANLAWWLRPIAGRRSTLSSILKALIVTTNMRDLNGAPLPLVGRAAYQLLSKVATPGQIQDMVHLAVEEVVPPTRERLTMEHALPSTDYLLGVIAKMMSTKARSRWLGMASDVRFAHGLKNSKQKQKPSPNCFKLAINRKSIAAS